MSEYSVFNSYGNLEYSSAPPAAEKIYNSLRASYVDRKTGIAAVDLTPGTYHEAKLYALAMALGDASNSTVRASNQEDALTATESIPHFEKAYRLSPRLTMTLEQRRAAVARRRLLSRGNRRETLYDELTTILGAALIAVRPIVIDEAITWPSDPSAGPGVFARPEQPASVVRLLDPVTAVGETTCDSYSESNQSNIYAVGNGTIDAAGQTFTGNGTYVSAVRFYLKKSGTPLGTAVVKIYAHTGTFGGADGLPTGAPLAVSDELVPSTLTGSYALTTFSFASDPVLLEDDVHYVAMLEYTAGTLGNTIDMGVDTTGPTHDGRKIYRTIADGGWYADSPGDLCFYVLGRPFCDLRYENWDTTHAAIQLGKGDDLCVQSENLGLAERVRILSVTGTGDARSLRASFENAHDVGASATTGPTPMWTSDAGHLLVVVTHEAAVNAELVGQVDELLTRRTKSGTTWSIVEPTTPGASTIGPFTLDTSPLGAVTIASAPIVPPNHLTMTSLTPDTGPAGGGTAVVVKGTGFTYVTQLLVGGVPNAFVIVDDQTITFTTPLSGGTVNITLTSSYGKTASLPFEFV